MSENTFVSITSAETCGFGERGRIPQTENDKTSGLFIVYSLRNWKDAVLVTTKKLKHYENRYTTLKWAKAMNDK